MTFSSMMVHMDVGTANKGVLRAAAALASRFGAGVIGIAASQPMPVIVTDGWMAGDLIEADLIEVAKETTEAEASFRAALEDKVARLTWRSVTARERLADYVVREARAADLIITGPDIGWSAFDSTRRVVVSNVVLHAGRPVLIVPRDTKELALDVVVVAWKDTREARRAIADAMPLLKMAGRVVLVEIAAADDIAAARDRLDDVAQWLDRHGVASECSARVSIENDAAQLKAIVRERSADVLVAGAYGHNRLREWVLGGVTRDLMVYPPCCCFLSH